MSGPAWALVTRGWACWVERGTAEIEPGCRVVATHTSLDVLQRRQLLLQAELDAWKAYPGKTGASLDSIMKTLRASREWRRR